MSGQNIKDPETLQGAVMEEIPSDDEDISDVDSEEVDDIDSEDISEETVNAEMKRLGFEKPIDTEDNEENEEEQRNSNSLKKFLWKIMKSLSILFLKSIQNLL